MTSADGAAPAPLSLEDRTAPALVSGAAFLRAPFDPATARAVAALAVGWLWSLTAGLVLWILVVVAAALVPVLGLGLPSWRCSSWRPVPSPRPSGNAS
nr:hypothetical protein GCM10025730_35360 [Promicromonospora thailandica]